MADRLPTSEEAQVLKKAAACRAVTQALFYHFQKHGLNTREGLLVLIDAFACIRDNQPTVDAQTEIKFLFLSMIENLPDIPPTGALTGKPEELPRDTGTPGVEVK